MANLELLFDKAVAAAEKGEKGARSIKATRVAKGLYIRYKDSVYSFNKSALKKWEGYGYEPKLIEKFGALAYDGFQGQWYVGKHLWMHNAPNKEVVSGSKDMNIIHKESLNVTRMSSYDIKYAIKAHEEKLKAPNDMRHYKAIVAAAKKLGWPKSYKDDLVKHDRQSLNYRDPKLAFGWGISESGTHMIFPEMTDLGKYVGAVADQKGIILFGWDGVVLREMSRERLLDFLRKARG